MVLTPNTSFVSNIPILQPKFIANQVDNNNIFVNICLHVPGQICRVCHTR